MNEVGLIRLFSLVHSTSHSEMERPLRMMKETLDANGYAGLTQVCDDNCCHLRAYLETLFPSLKNDVQPVECRSRYSHLTNFSIPADVNILYADNMARAESICHGLVLDLNSKADHACDIIGSFDGEWNVQVNSTGAVVSSSEDFPVMSMALLGRVVVFSLGLIGACLIPCLYCYNAIRLFGWAFRSSRTLPDCLRVGLLFFGAGLASLRMLILRRRWA